MARSIPEELADRQKRNGDRAACPICSPRHDRVRHDQLWEWSKRNIGERPLR
jgi:hypothetical protein